jgi:hypothetical protein
MPGPIDLRSDTVTRPSPGMHLDVARTDVARAADLVAAVLA